jgi:L-aspartate oxidase
MALTREAAHSVSRIIHAGGDATGIHIEETLSRKLMDSDVELKQNCLAVEIIKKDESVEGLKTLDSETNEQKEYYCRFLILATGGAGQLFTVTTNSEVATGDGVTLAYKAGACVKDMEFVQFHPTAIHLSGVAPFLISEAVRGEGGVLRNAAGHRFMPDYAKESDLAPRDIVSRSILTEMTREGGDEVYLDVTHLPASLISTRFPQIYRFCLDKGLDITREMIPVAPAAHYMIGGIEVDSWGESTIKNLFAAGEVACTGVHGANRLASNSLLEVPVFAKRIIRKTLDKRRQTKGNSEIKEKDTFSLAKRAASEKTKGRLNLEAIKQLMWHNVGIVRDGQGLEEAADMLAGWQSSLPETGDRVSYELESLIITGRLVTEAALIREESRGVHYRSDFPESLQKWQKHIIFKRTEGG